MSAVPADSIISSRWILPMTAPWEVLDSHSLVVRDGRILDVLPTALAGHRYAATVHVDRSRHLLLPGLVNAYTRIAPPAGRAIAPDRLHDGAQMCIAEMLASGTTCFCGLGYFPEESARTAVEQGLRALIGMPIAEAASPWANSPAEYLTRALNFRDEYRGHPLITTAFAPQSPSTMSDGTFARIATLADELDAGIVIALHESRAAVDESVIRHGVRPIERLHSLGLLTPALTAVHLAHVNAADIALAERSGIAVTLCPESNLRADNGSPSVASWTATELRLSVGSGVAEPAGSQDLWTLVRLLALLSHIRGAPGAPGAPSVAQSAWDALAVATRGGAAALGLDAEIGTLEPGKWADLCCVDLQTPAMQWASFADPQDALTQLVYKGGRDLVSDVWVSGRQLVNSGAFTRLDWPHAAARVNARRTSPITGE